MGMSQQFRNTNVVGEKPKCYKLLIFPNDDRMPAAH